VHTADRDQRTHAVPGGLRVRGVVDREQIHLRTEFGARLREPSGAAMGVLSHRLPLAPREPASAG
jgi:hypothetical protein